MNDIIDRLSPFVATIPDPTPDMMAEAKRKAKEAIISEHVKPVRQTDEQAVSKYPPVVVKYTSIALVLLFITSFIPSAIHIYTAVLEEQHHAPVSSGAISLMPMVKAGVDVWIVIIGICAVFGAELAIMVMVIGSQVFFSERGQMQRWFYAPIGLALGIAYVGNWVAVKPNSVFDILLLVAFPTFTLFISFIGKMLVLDIVQSKFESERKYQNDLQKYNERTAHPELDPKFLTVYNRYLLEYFKQIIGTGAGATERKRVIASMTADERHVFWLMLSNRTLDMESQEFVRLVVPSHARSSSVSISTSRARLASTAGGGDNVHNVSDVSETKTVSVETNWKQETSETGNKRISPEVQKALTYLSDNPHDMNKTVRELAEIIGVSPATISRVKNQMKNSQ